MARPLITLTTDFGEGSPYVAQLKAAILSLNPAARIVDISHSIAPQSLRQGALVLRDVTPGFPADCIHLAVVDPEVGGPRPIVFARIGAQNYIAPDNGLLGLLADEFECHEVVDISDERYWADRVSATFHGRDIMAPAAAHLSLGLPADHFGEATRLKGQLDWPRLRVTDGCLNGLVLAVDHFGNLITNVTRRDCQRNLGPHVSVEIGAARIDRLSRTYAEQSPGSLVALFGSREWLEIAVVQGNAARQLDAGQDAPVAVRTSPV